MSRKHCLTQAKKSKLNILVAKFPCLSIELIQKIIQHDFFESVVDVLIEEIDEHSFTEDEPLLLIAPNLNDQDSISYWNSGNYGLPATSPGARPWPGFKFLMINFYYNIYIFLFSRWSSSCHWYASSARS